MKNSDGGQKTAGAGAFGEHETAPAKPVAESMAESIVMLLMRLSEVEAERDFYKAAASKLMQPSGGGGKN